jgi:hypothetical protein
LHRRFKKNYNISFYGLVLSQLVHKFSIATFIFSLDFFDGYIYIYIYGLSDNVSIVLKIWVYGNSFKSKLVAVVVPHEENTKKWAYSNGHMGSFSELCSLDQLKNYVLSELKSTAERNKVISASK